MCKKMLVFAVSVTLGLLIAQQSFGQSSTTQTVTTQPNSTVTTVTTTPAKKAAAKTTETTVTTPATPRPTYDQATLKKMGKTLCTEGFEAKSGNDNKNVCLGDTTAPNIAYSCIYRKKGEATYPQTAQGPCNLDSAVHKGSMVMTKGDYTSSPPLPYGTKIECCFRSAVGQPTTSVTTTTTPKKK